MFKAYHGYQILSVAVPVAERGGVIKKVTNMQLEISQCLQLFHHVGTGTQGSLQVFLAVSYICFVSRFRTVRKYKTICANHISVTLQILCDVNIGAL